MIAHPTTESTGLAKRIEEAHRACERAVRTGLEHAIECGRLLAEAKQQIGHGGWQDWIGCNCSFSDRTARGYMRLHANQDLISSKRQSVADLGVAGALKLLAEPISPVEDLQGATASMETVTVESVPVLDDLHRRLDDPDVTLAELQEISRQAGDIQNRIAEARLRAMRAAGKAESSTYTPSPGMFVHIGAGDEYAEIIPSEHEGYFFLAMLIEDSVGDCMAEGTRTAMKIEHIIGVLPDRFKRDDVDLFEFPLGKEAASLAERDGRPWRFNRLLYSSHQEYMDHAILGMEVAR